jgi:hypothetical protein
VVPRPAGAVESGLSYVDRRSRKAMRILKRPDGFELESETVNRIELDSNPVGSVDIQIRIQLAVLEPSSNVLAIL